MTNHKTQCPYCGSDLGIKSEPFYGGGEDR